MVRLSTELKLIREIPTTLKTRLSKLGLTTIRDLLFHFPTRYEDFSSIVKIADAKPGEAITIRGVVASIHARKSWRRRFTIIEAIIEDETGSIKARWFNQPYLTQTLPPGRVVSLAGKIITKDDEWIMSNPSYEIRADIDEARGAHTGGLIPVYGETKGLTSKGIRYIVRGILKALPEIPEILPDEIIEHTGVLPIEEAFHKIHVPETLADVEEAKRRFAFNDIFFLQLQNKKARMLLEKEKAPPLSIDPPLFNQEIARLPFTLTNAQKRSLDEIRADLAKQSPMNRLLQGDVGSGKTILAAFAAFIAHGNKKQTAFMAPTEILARQHYKTLRDVFAHTTIGIGLITGSEARIAFGQIEENTTTKKIIEREIAHGSISIIIGTHSLIAERESPMNFNDLGLVIIDEQHRFGVEQRKTLVKRELHRGRETTVHFLSMSATPIPRTLALTLFGDLDISIIDELPPGRRPVITRIVAPENRHTAYAFVRGQLRKGRQVFVLCPRIKQSEDEGGEALLKAEIKSVEEEYKRLSTVIFPHHKVGMIHGKMKAKEKEVVMREFGEGKIDILVATSVIEVGINIPNASIMIIEGADRFGLAQLYQFRGRVGRGEHQSFCLLFTESKTESTHRRLEALVKAKNGFELAEEDLRLRGPGQFIGERQTGLPDISMNALSDMNLVRLAREEASKVLSDDPNLDRHPALQALLGDFEKRVHLE